MGGTNLRLITQLVSTVQSLTHYYYFQCRGTRGARDSREWSLSGVKSSFCMSVETYQCNVDKKANKVSSILRWILLYESIVDIDIDTSKVSSIISTSISIFNIANSVNKYLQMWTIRADEMCCRLYTGSIVHTGRWLSSDTAGQRSVIIRFNAVLADFELVPAESRRFRVQRDGQLGRHESWFGQHVRDGVCSWASTSWTSAPDGSGYHTLQWQ